MLRLLVYLHGDFIDMAKNNRPKVPRVTPFATRGITKRLRGSKIIYEQRDELAMDLLGLYSAKVTDVVDIVRREDGSTSVDLRELEDIPELHVLGNDRTFLEWSDG